MGETPEAEPLTDEQIDEARRSETHVAQVGDTMLRLLTSVANSGAIEVGITLMIGSGAMTGKLVGINAYLEILHEQFAAGGAAEVGQAIAEGFGFDDDEEDHGLPNFIHLAEAKWFTPDGRLVDLRVWRGRASAVDGWSMGLMSFT